MHGPPVHDTIVAVATGWRPAPEGAVRLSGPRSFELARSLGAEPPAGACPAATSARLDIAHAGRWPAHVLWFRAPRSFTGQDVVELHTVGALPLLRALGDALVAAGARRALPGEMTARAYLLGRLDAHQVTGVLGLLRAASDHAARDAARQVRTAASLEHDAWRDAIVELLARVEASIDFVDEEDVQFISPAELADRLNALIESGERGRPTRGELRRGVPHVALVGRPNAGKSALFNALIGADRAIVSPAVGATRDVLSCELSIAGQSLVLQDCAGLGDSEEAIDLAAYNAAERAAGLADVVLWLHDAGDAWTDAERRAFERLALSTRICVRSKADAGPLTHLAPTGFEPAIDVSVFDGRGLDALRVAIANAAAACSEASHLGDPADDRCSAVAALRRAREIVDAAAPHLAHADLAAMELRAALESLPRDAERPIDERVLDAIFRRFCVGK